LTVYFFTLNSIMLIQSIAFEVLHVNPKTNWSFVVVTMDNGVVGTGECSLNGWEPLQLEYLELMRPSWQGACIDTVEHIQSLCQTYAHSAGGIVAHSVKSAMEQALCDALAQSQRIPVWKLFCTTPARTEVAVYANINRATLPRTPQGFAQSAQQAVAQGYRAIKLAPFDGVLPDTCAMQTAQIEAGLARVRAVRETVGSGVRVMVDCHWRFTESVANSVLDALAEVRLDWFECPVSEANHEALLRLRKRAHAHDCVLAGAEMLTEVEGFAPIFAKGLYDVVMPDVKYCGGLGAMIRIADAGAHAGVQVAPHNPTGPICNFASVHACLAHPAMDLLELQVGESALFTKVVDCAYPIFESGTFALPNQPGLGAALSRGVLAQHPFTAVPFGLDERLG
jgi:galactonate dehydratase